MKNNRTAKYCGLALAGLLAGGASSSFAQTATLVLNSFDSGTQGTQPIGCGTWYGTGTGGWDGNEDDSGNSGGSLLITTVFNSSSDTPCMQFICLPNENPWWNQPTTINLSQYKSIDFDIKWDNTSDITIDQFNDLSTWPASLLQSWAPAGYLAGSIPGLEIDVVGVGQNGFGAVITTTNIPAAAGAGWTHISIPINATEAGLDGCSGFAFHKWIYQQWGILNGVSARFWIDNVTLIGTAGPPPPPTISPLTKSVQGLNVFASTTGLNDRQEVVLVNSNGLSWVGNTGSGPVTYSFTISSFPKVPAYTAEAYLFLVPNPASRESAPDWNETNVAWLVIQSTATGGEGIFQYKVNEPAGDDMLFGNGSYASAPGSWPGTPDLSSWTESGNLTNVQSSQLLGTWTLKFTSDQNGMIIAPDGTTASFTIPSYYIANFAETKGFNVYLGMQANSTSGANQAVVFSDFSVQGVPSSYSETFTGETTLNASIWNNGYATGPAGVLIVPPGSAYWIQWTLPDAGFGLEQTASLAGPWSPVTTGAVIPGAEARLHLLSTASLPAGNSAFFHLAKRVFTQLQVLLPGETAAPGTFTGKTGTPTPANTSDVYAYTVNAVDANWFPVAGVSDSITISSSDGAAFTPLNAPLVNGTAQFQIQFQTGGGGTQTITATDVTDGTKTANTSSPVVVN